MNNNAAFLEDDKPLDPPSLARIWGEVGVLSLIPLAALFQLAGIVSTDVREACGDEAFLASTIPGALLCLLATYQLIADLVKGDSKMTNRELADGALSIPVCAFFLVGAPFLYFINDSPSHGETVGLAIFDFLLLFCLVTITFETTKSALKHRQGMLESLKNVGPTTMRFWDPGVLRGPLSLQAPDLKEQKKSDSWFSPFSCSCSGKK